MFNFKVLNISLILMGFSCANVYAFPTLSQMNDQEMSETTGQALMSLSYLAPNDSTNPMKNITGSNNIGFYKLGLEAELELNANIKNLQLGCAGTNGAGACDIDIKNLSLSGLPESYDSNGNPVFTNGRASTSGKLTNPFIEFAIVNPDSAATREVKGLRFSAEKINALLTAGLDNNPTATTTDGIQSLSGFMQVAKTTGTAQTQQTLFGKSSTQVIGGFAKLCAGLISDCLIYNRNIHFESDPLDPKSTGITVPSVTTNFEVPAFTVNGVRQSQAVVNNIRTVINSIPIAADGSSQYPSSMFTDDQLRVNLSCDGVTGGSGIPCGLLSFLKDQATFKMGQGSAIENLNMKIDFIQSLSMIHNIPLTGTGGYLSLQDIALIWPGATVANVDKNLNTLAAMSGNTDVAQTGWWMSFAEPVQLGHLNVTQPVILDDNTLAQVATRVTEALTQIGPNTPQASANNLIALAKLLADQPLTSKVIADLGAATASNPVYLRLTNQQLGNQKVVANCYGSLKFC